MKLISVRLTHNLTTLPLTILSPSPSSLLIEPPVSPASGLPPPWQEIYNDQYKRPFYYNPVTQARTWERPTAPTQPKTQTIPQSNEQTKRIQQRPLPSVPGQQPTDTTAAPSPNTLRKRATMPNTQSRPTTMKKREVPLPSLPEKTQEQPKNMPNGLVHSRGGRHGGSMSDHAPAAIPGQGDTQRNTLPSTPKTSDSPPELPPTNRARHASVTTASRPRGPVPIPGIANPRQVAPVLRSSSQRELPPLPPKEQAKEVPPLPLKEDISQPPQPSPQHKVAQPNEAGPPKRNRKNSVEYEDAPVFKTKKTAPPLPKKEDEHPEVKQTLHTQGPPPPLPEKDIEVPPLPEKSPPPQALPSLPEKEVSSRVISPAHVTNSHAPPPPPPPQAGGPPPPPPLGAPPPPSPNIQSSRQIRSHSEAVISPSDSGGRPFSANDLLAGAQKLKKVEMTPDMRRNTVPQVGGGLEGTLNRAIADKFRNVNYSD